VAYRASVVVRTRHAARGLVKKRDTAARTGIEDAWAHPESLLCARTMVQQIAAEAT
jgi:hypothetical protein